MKLLEPIEIIAIRLTILRKGKNGWRAREYVEHTCDDRTVRRSALPEADRMLLAREV